MSVYKCENNLCRYYDARCTDGCISAADLKDCPTYRELEKASNTEINIKIDKESAEAIAVIASTIKDLVTFFKKDK